MNFSLKKRRISLLSQMIMLFTIVLFVSMLLVSAIFSGMIEEIMKDSVGQQAMTVAKLTAKDQTIIHAFQSNTPSEQIQPIAEKIRMVTGASYIVVGNRDGIRLSHNDPENIGKPLGTSNDAVFEDQVSIIYEGTGVSGPAVKAKTPIYDAGGDMIGVSSVGYTLGDIAVKVEQYRAQVLELVIMLFALGCGGAVLIARRVKRLIFGLEPEEIAFLFQEKEATIESIRDAIVAVDLNDRVVSMNRRAREMFKDNDLEISKPINITRIQNLLQDVIREKKEKSNQNIVVGLQFYVMNLSPIMHEDTVIGVVLTIRTLSEIEQLTDEVTKIKASSEQMRAQNHEYLNKLNTIYGLINLGEYDKALEMISGEVKERQNVIEFLISSVKDPLIAACLLGKINRSKERKVHLNIDMESNLTGIPDGMDTQLIVTILGNLIDNAMDSAREKHDDMAVVHVSFTDFGPDLVFDIEDNGGGVPKDKENLIFNDGYTTKQGENRGIGLFLVQNTLCVLQGSIQISRSEIGGARFTVIVPKYREGRKIAE